MTFFYTGSIVLTGVFFSQPAAKFVIILFKLFVRKLNQNLN